jgi:hypothetical protein
MHSRPERAGAKIGSLYRLRDARRANMANSMRASTNASAASQANAQLASIAVRSCAGLSGISRNLMPVASAIALASAAAVGPCAHSATPRKGC